MIKRPLVALPIALYLFISACNTRSNSSNEVQKDTVPQEINYLVPQKHTIFKDLGDNNIVSSLLDTIKTNKPVLVCTNTPLPSTFGDLNLKDVFSSNVSVDIGTDLSGFGFTGSFAKKDVLISAYLIAYKDFLCDDSTTRRVMAGIKLYVHASQLKISFKSPTLPQIAAAVELNMGKAECRIQILGLKASNIYSQLPSASFDVDSYSKVITAYDGIIHGLTENTPIDPIIATVKNGKIITTP